MHKKYTDEVGNDSFAFIAFDHLEVEVRKALGIKLIATDHKLVWLPKSHCDVEMLPMGGEPGIMKCSLWLMNKQDLWEYEVEIY